VYIIMFFFTLVLIVSRELFTHPPIVGGTPPIDVNTHPKTVLPPLGVCVLF